MKSFIITMLAVCTAAQRRSRRDDPTATGAIIHNQGTGGNDVSDLEAKEFLEYAARYGKGYKDADEFGKRQQLWIDTDKLIKSANENARFKTGHNKFSDMSQDEKDKLLNLHKPEAANATGRNLRGFFSYVEKEEEVEVTQSSPILKGGRKPRDGGSGGGGSTTLTCKGGQYFDTTTNRCKPCNSGCVTCTSFTECSACKDPNMILNSDGSCTCEFGYNRNGSCKKEVICSEGTYLDTRQGVCKACSTNCAKCTNNTTCDACRESFDLVDGLCVCQSGLFDASGQCLPVIDCSIANCSACLDEVTCAKCDTGYFVSNGVCEVQPVNECPFSYGPVASPSGCLNDRYSSERLIPPFDSTATTVDWRDWGIVNPVRDQGSCGSCWAFMTTSQVETWYSIRYGPLLEASEQHLVDCDRSWNMGCSGGWPTEAFNFYAKDGVIDRNDYKYVAREQTCMSNQYDRMFFLNSTSSYRNVSPDLNSFKNALRLGPLSVAFAVSNTFMYYTQGIYDGDCAADINHGMTGVGFGVENGTEYVIVRNSWGSAWGEQGYVRIILDTSSQYGKCQVYGWPSYPIVA